MLLTTGVHRAVKTRLGERPRPASRCVVRCAQSQPSQPQPPQSTRRAVLHQAGLAGLASAGALQALYVPPVQAGEFDGFTKYERGNRTRFETSISSALRPYTLLVPDDWKEEIVSLNDGKLYGVDLRFGNKAAGQLAVSVLPYANRDSITQVGNPEDALDTFLELVGAFWAENGFGNVGRINGLVSTSSKTDKKGQVYYQYELRAPNSLLVANATDGQLYLLNVSGNRTQWASSEAKLRSIASSFSVPPAQD